MITIRIMNEDERERVGVFVQNTMRKRYKCDAYELPKIVFSAWRGGELLGAMGLSMSDGAPFSLEKSYALDYRTFPTAFERTKIVELGRWSVAVPHISEALMYAAICYALQHQREWGIGEVKPQVARRFASFADPPSKIILWGMIARPFFTLSLALSIKTYNNMESALSI